MIKPPMEAPTMSAKRLFLSERLMDLLLGLMRLACGSGVAAALEASEMMATCESIGLGYLER
jgi:hypothetical protein